MGAEFAAYDTIVSLPVSKAAPMQLLLLLMMLERVLRRGPWRSHRSGASGAGDALQTSG